MRSAIWGRNGVAVVAFDSALAPQRPGDRPFGAALIIWEILAAGEGRGGDALAVAKLLGEMVGKAAGELEDGGFGNIAGGEGGVVGYSPSPNSLPIGSVRTRIRCSSNTTTHPCCRDASMERKFASSSAICLSGRRSVPRRNRINEGFRSAASASSVPKSVSADTRTRSFSLA